MKIIIDQVNKNIYSSAKSYIYENRYKTASKKLYAPIYIQLILFIPASYLMRNAPWMPYPFIIAIFLINMILILSGYLEYNSKVIFEKDRIYTQFKNTNFHLYSCKLSDNPVIVKDQNEDNHYTLYYQAAINETFFKIRNDNIPNEILDKYLKATNS